MPVLKLQSIKRTSQANCIVTINCLYNFSIIPHIFYFRVLAFTIPSPGKLLPLVLFFPLIHSEMIQPIPSESQYILPLLYFIFVHSFITNQHCITHLGICLMSISPTTIQVLIQKINNLVYFVHCYISK